MNVYRLESKWSRSSDFGEFHFGSLDLEGQIDENLVVQGRWEVLTSQREQLGPENKVSLAMRGILEAMDMGVDRSQSIGVRK